MEKDFVKVLHLEVINDDLSLNDLKGGMFNPSDAEACCTDNSACNVNQTGVEDENQTCCNGNSACNIN